MYIFKDQCWSHWPFLRSSSLIKTLFICDSIFGIKNFHCVYFFNTASALSVMPNFFCFFTFFFSCLNLVMSISLCFASYSASFAFLLEASIFLRNLLFVVCVTKLGTLFMVSWSKSFISFSCSSMFDSDQFFLLFLVPAILHKVLIFLLMFSCWFICLTKVSVLFRD